MKQKRRTLQFWKALSWLATDLWCVLRLRRSPSESDSQFYNSKMFISRKTIRMRSQKSYKSSMQIDREKLRRAGLSTLLGLVGPRATSISWDILCSSILLLSSSSQPRPTSSTLPLGVTLEFQASLRSIYSLIRRWWQLIVAVTPACVSGLIFFFTKVEGLSIAGEKLYFWKYLCF